MSATPENIAQLRRMVNEPTTATYSDELLASYIETYPLIDGLGREPLRPSASNPPVLEVNPDWVSRYDLNAAAADIWDEKAAALFSNMDFSGAGQSFKRAQPFEHAQKRARYYRSRRAARTITARPVPRQNPEAENVL